MSGVDGVAAGDLGTRGSEARRRKAAGPPKPSGRGREDDNREPGEAETAPTGSAGGRTRGRTPAAGGGRHRDAPRSRAASARRRRPGGDGFPREGREGGPRRRPRAKDSRTSGRGRRHRPEPPPTPPETRAGPSHRRAPTPARRRSPQERLPGGDGAGSSSQTHLGRQSQRRQTTTDGPLSLFPPRGPKHPQGRRPSPRRYRGATQNRAARNAPAGAGSSLRRRRPNPDEEGRTAHARPPPPEGGSGKRGRTGGTVQPAGEEPPRGRARRPATAEAAGRGRPGRDLGRDRETARATNGHARKTDGNHTTPPLPGGGPATPAAPSQPETDGNPGSRRETPDTRAGKDRRNTPPRPPKTLARARGPRHVQRHTRGKATDRRSPKADTPEREVVNIRHRPG